MAVLTSLLLLVLLVSSAWGFTIRSPQCSTPIKKLQPAALFLSNNNSEDDASSRDDFGRFLRGIFDSKYELEQGSIVVARADIPNLGIWMDQAYELKEIYLQGSTSDGMVERIPLSSVLDTTGSIKNALEMPTGYTQYVKLYSPVYHKESGAVIVTPEEVGFVTFRTEVQDSILFALPILAFWLTISYTFVTQYTQRFGGTFMDAFFGR
jgi:hypothetical protein